MNAPSDGSVILQTPASMLMIYPHIYRKLNHSDSEIVASILAKDGYELAATPEEADLVLLNTCSIREKAEYTVMQRINEMNNLKAKNKGLKVGVLGCMAERMKENLLVEKRVVDLVVGPDAYRNLPQLLEEVGSGQKAVNVLLSREETYGFSTPFATLHAFNGWADRFPATPVNGLDDRYIGIGGKIGKAVWAASYHDFRADHGNQAYGREFDASIGYPFNKHVSGLLKLADYRSDGFASDVRKLWASIEYKY